MRESIEKWEAFASQYPDNTIRVLDGHVFHSGLDELVFIDAPRQLMLEYVQRVFESLSQLKIAFIYLSQVDIATSLDRTCRERGSKWQKYQVDWKSNSPFCKNRNLSGYEAYRQLFINYGAICDAAFEIIPKPKLFAERTASWIDHLERMLEFLGIEFRSGIKSTPCGTAPGLRIEGERGLKDLRVLTDLKEIFGDLSLKHNPDLESLQGLEQLTTVHGTLDIWGNPQLRGIAGLDQLQKVEGSLRIVGNPKLPDAKGLVNLKSVDHDLLILRNKNLRCLSELHNLDHVGGRVLLNTNPSLENIDALLGLKRIQGRVEISDNPSLKNVHGLKNLQTVGGEIEISYNSPSIASSASELVKSLKSIGWNGNYHFN